MDKAFSYPNISQYIKDICNNDINPPKNKHFIHLFVKQILNENSSIQ